MTTWDLSSGGRRPPQFKFDDILCYRVRTKWSSALHVVLSDMSVRYDIGGEQEVTSSHVLVVLGDSSGTLANPEGIMSLQHRDERLTSFTLTFDNQR